ncbi:uncharacterized protein LY89DRAFT_733460 [Mollisia scopiformis]|uniref:Uncharacterized protein n=1 Tax=Mollisia scopiformis TaxID=149040 RepID=A0A194XCZ1_MOLSC|nr:uncharacterized protein LY89DRAFT_733460 [Mollisia scopiformis]KUJ17622.1 hypothetical protein LY89DRAFT_733460 [Mollisia scopiformis]
MSVEDVDTSSRPLVETTLRLVGVGSSDEGIEKLLLVLKSDTLVGTALTTIKVEDVDAEVMLPAVVDSTSRIVDVSDERLGKVLLGLMSTTLADPRLASEFVEDVATSKLLVGSAFVDIESNGRVGELLAVLTSTTLIGVALKTWDIEDVVTGNRQLVDATLKFVDVETDERFDKVLLVLPGTKIESDEVVDLDRVCKELLVLMTPITLRVVVLNGLGEVNEEPLAGFELPCVEERDLELDVKDTLEDLEEGVPGIFEEEIDESVEERVCDAFLEETI